ncbi:hypothetical protein BDZ88DRAFT_221933 [Geranomyces variabilis]|nr:hypothetical protein BDZ88DRAFT_221933 [Geranomyces variabilis]
MHNHRPQAVPPTPPLLFRVVASERRPPAPPGIQAAQEEQKSSEKKQRRVGRTASRPNIPRNERLGALVPHSLSLVTWPNAPIPQLEKLTRWLELLVVCWLGMLGAGLMRLGCLLTSAQTPLCDPVPLDRRLAHRNRLNFRQPPHLLGIVITLLHDVGKPSICLPIVLGWGISPGSRDGLGLAMFHWRVPVNILFLSLFRNVEILPCVHMPSNTYPAQTSDD